MILNVLHRCFSWFIADPLAEPVVWSAHRWRLAEQETFRYRGAWIPIQITVRRGQ